jgi:hypothetical protein
MGYVVAAVILLIVAAYLYWKGMLEVGIALVIVGVATGYEIRDASCSDNDGDSDDGGDSDSDDN